MRLRVPPIRLVNLAPETADQIRCGRRGTRGNCYWATMNPQRIAPRAHREARNTTWRDEDHSTQDLVACVSTFVVGTLQSADVKFAVVVLHQRYLLSENPRPIVSQDSWILPIPCHGSWQVNPLQTNSVASILFESRPSNNCSRDGSVDSETL